MASIGCAKAQTSDLQNFQKLPLAPGEGAQDPFCRICPELCRVICPKVLIKKLSGMRDSLEDKLRGLQKLGSKAKKV